MKHKIIISTTNSRLLDSIKISIPNHAEYVDFYILNVEEIFKAYDIIKPYKICIAKSDIEHFAIKTFMNQYHAMKDLFIIDDLNNFKHVINREIFKKYSISRNNKRAILLDNIEELPSNIVDLTMRSDCDIHMFNNSKINNPYNLGTLLEHQKAFILASYKSIIGKNHIYKNESLLCGASYIDMDTMVAVDNMDSDIIDINDYIKKEFYVNN
jgi:hypothetical protein